MVKMDECKAMTDHFDGIDKLVKEAPHTEGAPNFRRVRSGGAIINGRKPRSCLGQVFNSKLGCIATPGSNCMVCMQPLLKLKTRPKARPVS